MAGPGNVTRKGLNKIKPDFTKVIYMDAGCWQSRERGMPNMTFGLLEHNSIALCTYFSYGKATSIPIKPEINYDFFKTRTYTFLSKLMTKKYNIEPSPRDPIVGYHILKIIPFPDNALLDDIEELRIFIPDLHLHFFKDTLLDNFITYYRNEWSGNQIIPVKLKKRISMETDFAEFLKTISEFQKQISKKTRIHFLGDMYEMWETESIIRNFTSKDQVKKYYESLDALVEWLWDGINKANATNIRSKKLKMALKKLMTTKLSLIPLDNKIEKQVKDLYRTIDWKKFLIEPEDTADLIKKKAKFMANRILRKHKGADGKNFLTLLDSFSWKYLMHGNHDNFLYGLEQPNNTFCPFGVELRGSLFRSDYTFENCKLMYKHGHNMDDFNNDEACGIGRLITLILSFYELKNRGDLIKDLEALFRSDEEVRLDYIKKIARICYMWEEQDHKSRKRNKIIVLAHTHVPYMEDITTQYFIWKGMVEAWPKRDRNAWTIKRQF